MEGFISMRIGRAVQGLMVRLSWSSLGMVWRSCGWVIQEKYSLIDREREAWSKERDHVNGKSFYLEGLVEEDVNIFDSMVFEKVRSVVGDFNEELNCMCLA